MGTYSISILSDNDILLLEFFNEIGIKISRECRAEAADIAKKNNIHRILIDITKAFVKSTPIENYEFHYEDPDVWGRSMKMAFVLNSTNRTDESAKFSENVAINRGMVRKSFKNRDDACSWLMESK